VQSLTRPSGAAVLTGPAPTDSSGNPLDPINATGHDHCAWLDRMVRGNQPLVERLALVFHDWFGVSNAEVDQTQLMLDHVDVFRRQGFGSFRSLLEAMTTDPAMLVFLNGNQNRRGRPNENYGRELMELFSLGADRGAYTETDVREIARALTGWRSDYVSSVGNTNFRFDPNRFDNTNKTVFGKTGNWGWKDAVRLCVEHPLHASFFVTKLWGYFIPTPPDAATQAALQRLYTAGGRYDVRAVLEAILQHPDLYAGEPMVKPPVVFTAGLLRALGRPVDTHAWWYLNRDAEQRLYHPPNVAGWEDGRWLDTSTIFGRWVLTDQALRKQVVSATGYDREETAATAWNKALAAMGNPALSAATRDALVAFANSAPVGTSASYRAMRQNALRQLIAMSPDAQTC
jgi:uncharacterized protein (DUF1800 family)